MKHRGVSGAVTADNLSGLFPSAAADASAIVQMWVGDDNLVRRVRIEGQVAPDDSPGVVRVLDLDGFDQGTIKRHIREWTADALCWFG